MVKAARRKKTVFKKAALVRVQGVHRLSTRYNQKIGKAHSQRLLELMRHHVVEIEELAQRRDPHFLVETGDLAVLCLELLLEHRAAPDEILEQCFGRYERKLEALLTEIESERLDPSDRLKRKRRK